MTINLLYDPDVQKSMQQLIDWKDRCVAAALPAHAALLKALERAEEFLAGFEDDEDQNMDDLLAEVRGAIAQAKGEDPKESGHG